MTSSELNVVQDTLKKEYEKRANELAETKKKLKQLGMNIEEFNKLKNKIKPPESKEEDKPISEEEAPETLDKALEIDVKLEDLSKYDTLYITTMAVDAVLSEDLIKKAGQKGLNKYQILGQFLMNEINDKSYVDLDPELTLNNYLKPASEAVESDEVKEAIQATKIVYASQVAKIILNEPGRIKNENWDANASEVLEVLAKPGVEKALKKQLNGYGKDLKGFDLYFSVYLREKGLPVEKVSETMSKVKKIKHGANAFSLMGVEEDESIN
ncbi:hypothetical protein GF352_02055 [archaeon]|nr:hypothetical protein [archaeon]